MKIVQLPILALSLLIISIFVPGMPGISQTNQSTSPVPGAIVSSERNWGMPTNGICGEAAVIWKDGRSTFPVIVVDVINTNSGGFYGPASSSNEIAAFVDSFNSNTDLYFAPTNQFCGPIELRNANGVSLVPLKPEVSSSKAYPPVLEIGAARKNNARSQRIAPSPLGSWSDRLAEFRIEDYFKIVDSGEYHLIVWPKIYRRPNTKSDTCVRIDLPPVSVMFKWTAGTTN